MRRRLPPSRRDARADCGCIAIVEDPAMKLSLCPRSSFPAPATAPVAPNDVSFEPAALPRVEAIPSRKDLKSKRWLHHRTASISTTDHRDTDSDN